MSRSPLRLALLSAWHVHARDYLREARALDGLEVTALWDDDPERGRAFATEHDLPFRGDLDALLADGSGGSAGVDGVIVTTPTADHREVIARAAAAGKHVFSEKVLALDPGDAAACLEAVDAAGVQLMLSLPRLSGSVYLTAQRVLDENLLGRVTLARCRVAHDGAVRRDAHPDGWLPERFFRPEEALGGAMIDLGAHPIYLLNRLLGAPEAVTSAYARASGRAVDDNSVIVAEYGGGALGLMETSFVSAAGPGLLELHGSDGVLLAENDRLRLRRFDEGHRRSGDGWLELSPAEPLPSPMAQWRDRILHGRAPTIGRADWVDLTRVNAAAAEAARSGRRTPLPDPF